MEPALETPPRRPSTDPADARSPSSGVNATLRILDLVAARGPLSLADLTRELGLAKSTVHRICGVLVERAWAVREPDGRFSLGIRALRLGSNTTELPIVTAFHTVAASFLDELDETLALAVVDGDESLYIAMEETSQPVRYVTHIGSKSPAFASASGRVVLASQPAEAVTRPVCGAGVDHPHGAPTPRDARVADDPRRRPPKWPRRELGRDRTRTVRRFRPGDERRRHDAGFALTTLIPRSRVTPERHETIVACLRRHGAMLSELVGWLPAYSSRTSTAD